MPPGFPAARYAWLEASMANMALLSTGTRHPIDQDYNGTIRKLGGYELFFLGAPRIRQLRVTNTSCKVADAIVDALPVGGGACHAEWSQATNMDTAYGAHGWWDESVAATAKTEDKKKRKKGTNRRARSANSTDATAGGGASATPSTNTTTATTNGTVTVTGAGLNAGGRSDKANTPSPIYAAKHVHGVNSFS